MPPKRYETIAPSATVRVTQAKSARAFAARIFQRRTGRVSRILIVPR
jgi:hypothetical protein